MLTGHTSHQIGLDVDIWFTPAPDHELSDEEREFDSAAIVVAEIGATSTRSCGRTRIPKWSAPRRRIRVVARIFVNAAIKKAMCREAGAIAPGSQGAAVVASRRSFSCAPQLPGREPRLQAATARRQ